MPAANEWVIAIPSHARAGTLQRKTLRVLRHYGISPDRIFVFVAPQEVSDYEPVCAGEARLIPSVMGLAEQRRYMRHYFAEGQRVVYMDDDIAGLVAVCDQSAEHATCACHNKQVAPPTEYVKHRELSDLSGAIATAFAEMGRAGAHLGGVYPVANGWMMRHSVTTDLRYIVGCLYFEINEHAPQWDLAGGEGEDYERTLRHFTRYGAIVRLNWIAPQTSYFKGAGGLNATRTVASFRDALLRIQQQFPTLCDVKETARFPKLVLKARAPRCAGVL